MLAIATLALEFAPIAMKLIEAGINVSGVVGQIRTSLDANAAPDDPTWRLADAAVKGLVARALDPATDNR